MKRLARKFGWWLQGYPAAIHTPHVNIPNTPGWKRVYRLGTRIYDWGDR